MNIKLRKSSYKLNKIMLRELKDIQDFILKGDSQKIENITKDVECEEYFGCSFQLNKLNIKFRKAKVTPKKTGLFVTLWKRNKNKVTEPFTEKDHYDFYIVATEQDGNFGFFLFPKQILIEKLILTTNIKEGKRGFRVYPDWSKTENKQAENT